MRLLEDLKKTSKVLSIILIFLIVFDFISYAIYDILNISYSRSKSKNYSYQLTAFIVKILMEIILISILVAIVISKKLMPIIFSTIIYILIFFVLLLCSFLSNFTSFARPSRPVSYYTNNIDSIIEIFTYINYIDKLIVSVLLIFYVRTLKIVEKRETKEFLLNSEKSSLEDSKKFKDFNTTVTKTSSNDSSSNIYLNGNDRNDRNINKLTSNELFENNNIGHTGEVTDDEDYDNNNHHLSLNSHNSLMNDDKERRQNKFDSSNQFSNTDANDGKFLSQIKNRLIDNKYEDSDYNECSEIISDQKFETPLVKRVVNDKESEKNFNYHKFNI